VHVLTLFNRTSAVASCLGAASFASCKLCGNPHNFARHKGILKSACRHPPASLAAKNKTPFLSKLENPSREDIPLSQLATAIGRASLPKISCPRYTASPKRAMAEDLGLTLRLIKESRSGTVHEAPNIDIVFVHGLQGHSSSTWTYGESTLRSSYSKKELNCNSTFWPGDLLPTDIPEARIFSWEYNTSWHGCWEDRLVEQAENLLTDLTDSLIGRAKSVSTEDCLDQKGTD
jgi:hypothetical protein